MSRTMIYQNLPQHIQTILCLHVLLNIGGYCSNIHLATEMIENDDSIMTIMCINNVFKLPIYALCRAGTFHMHASGKDGWPSLYAPIQFWTTGTDPLVRIGSSGMQRHHPKFIGAQQSTTSQQI